MSINFIKNDTNSSRNLENFSLQKNETPLVTFPSEWIPLPAMAVGDNKFAGLLAVYPQTAVGDNYLAIKFAVNTGTYSIDWGDGSAVETITSNSQATHNYDYNSASLTSTTLGYKLALVVVTPTTAGAFFTSVDLNETFINKSGTARYNWLDIKLSAPNLTVLNFGGSSAPSNVDLGKLQRFEYVGGNSISNFDSTFSNLSSLKQIVSLDTSSGTSFFSMFNRCGSLKSIPSLDTSGGINFASMFSHCNSLESIPSLDTSSGTGFGSMFLECSSLKSIPWFDTSSGTIFGSMFYNCNSLKSIPLLDTSGGTSFSTMFYGCDSLESIPPLNTSSGTNFGSMFFGCRSLETIPLLDTSSGTNFANMFLQCHSLKTIPSLNTSSGTNFSNMFASCFSLQSIPLLDTSSGTDFTSMFISCYNLSYIPALNFTNGAAIGFSNTFAEMYALQRCEVTGISATVSFEGTNLSGTALNEIYTNLGTVSGAFITVTGVWGAATDDPTIATNKGWNVTG